MSNITIIKSKLNQGLALTQQESWELSKYIKALEQEPKTGHWIEGNYHIRCSECGEDYPYSIRNYCPNCGAKMKAEEELCR